MTLETNLPPVPAAEAARRQAAMDHEAAQQATLELLRIQGALSLAAFKGLLVANGGAIIALFTFIGNSTESMDRAKILMAFFLS